MKMLLAGAGTDRLVVEVDGLVHVTLIYREPLGEGRVVEGGARTVDEGLCLYVADGRQQAGTADERKDQFFHV